MDYLRTFSLFTKMIEKKALILLISNATASLKIQL